MLSERHANEAKLPIKPGSHILTVGFTKHPRAAPARSCKNQMPDALQAVEESSERRFIARIQRLARCESAEVAQCPLELRFATTNDNDPRSCRAQ